MVQTEFGRQIADARKRKDWYQHQLASRLGCKPSRIGSAEAGYRSLNVADIRALIEIFDDAEFAFAAARYVTDGLVGTLAGALNGTRTAAAMAVGVELAELQADMARAQVMLLRDPMMADSETLESVVQNLLDVAVTANQMFVELARDYGLSHCNAVREHVKRLEAKGYVQKESHPRERVA